MLDTRLLDIQKREVELREIEGILASLNNDNDVAKAVDEAGLIPSIITMNVAADEDTKENTSKNEETYRKEKDNQETLNDEEPGIVISEDEAPIEFPMSEEVDEGFFVSGESCVSKKCAGIGSGESIDEDALIARQAAYVKYPMEWMKDVCPGWTLLKWQEEEMKAFNDNKFTALSTGHGVGKSTWLAIIICYFLTTRPFAQVPCTAPTQHQLEDVLWSTLSRVIRKSKFLSSVLEWTQTKVSVKGHKAEWFAVARTATPKAGEKSAEGLQGFHGADHLLMVGDEFSGVADQIASAIDGALTKKNAKVVLCSNPTRKEGYFYNVVFGGSEGKGNPLWHTRVISSMEVPEEIVDKSYIENIINNYGIESDEYRVKVLGLPPLSSEYALLSPEAMFAAHARSEATKVGVKVLSLDSARFGDDDSVTYVREGMHIGKRKSVHGFDTSGVVGMVMDQFDEHDPNFVVIDDAPIAAGIIDGVKEELKKRKKSSRLVLVCAGSSPTEKNKKKYLNLRAEIGLSLREVIKSLCIDEATPLLDQECTTIRYKWDQRDAKMQIMSKDQIKAEIGRSSDDFDAFALLFAPDILGINSSVSDEYFKFGVVDGRGDKGAGGRELINDGLKGLESRGSSAQTTDIPMEDIEDAWMNVGSSGYDNDGSDFYGVVGDGKLGGGRVGVGRYANIEKLSNFSGSGSRSRSSLSN